MSRERRCQKGKPCGATCISRLDICRIDLVSELSDGLGKVRDSVPQGEEGKTKPSQGATEKYQKDFLKHVEENSAGYSNATFKPMDLANMLVQASNDLEGESKDSIKKLMEFAVKDGQALIVSTSKPPNDSKDIKVVRRLASLLDKSYPELGLKFEEKIERIKALKAEEREKVKEDRQRKADGLLPIWRERISRIRSDSRKLGKELKEARESIFQAGVTRSDNPGNWGFTSPLSKRVVVTDRSSIPSDRFVKGEQADAKLVSKQIKDTMEFRANNPRLTSEEQDKTKFVAGRFAEGKTNSAYLYVYVHELGHQVHFRSGTSLPPPESTTVKRGTTFPHSNRGISQYSKFNEKETFAEAFAAFVFNPTALRQQDEPLYNWVKSNFETAIERAGAPVR